MTKTLKHLCDEIEAGYAADKSMLDDDMVDLVQELADRTEEIKELIAKVDNYERPGFKLVPIEPTWEMQITGSTSFRGPGSGHYTDRMNEAKQCWANMIKEVK